MYVIKFRFEIKKMIYLIEKSRIFQINYSSMTSIDNERIKLRSHVLK